MMPSTKWRLSGIWRLPRKRLAAVEMPPETHSGEGWDDARRRLHLARLAVDALLNDLRGILNKPDPK